MKRDTIILLDVPLEGLFKMLQDRKWNVKTVTKELGAGKNERSDDKIIEYAQIRDCVVVTLDKGLIERCNALDIETANVEQSMLVKVIHEKLEKKLESL